VPRGWPGGVHRQSRRLTAPVYGAAAKPTVRASDRLRRSVYGECLGGSLLQEQTLFLAADRGVDLFFWALAQRRVQITYRRLPLASAGPRRLRMQCANKMSPASRWAAPLRGPVWASRIAVVGRALNDLFYKLQMEACLRQRQQLSTVVARLRRSKGYILRP
jgi:hypothetical protein